MPETLAPPAAPPKAPYHARELRPDEWGRLADVPLGQNPPDPEQSIVIVVEDAGGRILAVWSAMNTIHLEGLWADEAVRKNPSVTGKLYPAMRVALVARGISAVLTLVETPEVATLAESVGFRKVPGDLYLLQLESG